MLRNVRSLRFVLRTTLAASTVLAGLAAAPRAYANPMPGEGYAGKPNPAFPQGDRCGRCHTGGAAPTATLTGPTTLAAGATGEYSLRVQTALARTGAAVAATDGVDLTAGSNMAKQVEELTHSGAPKMPQGGATTFTFSAKAPATGTTFTIFYVGMAANNNGNTGGDSSTAILTQQVTVTGGASSGGTDGGASSGGGDGGGASSGGRVDGGTSGGASSGATSSGSSGRTEEPAPEEGGCRASGGGVGSAGGAGLAAALALGLVALGRRRRRA